MTAKVTEMVFLTPAAGKRLIAKAVCALTEVKRALAQHTVVIIAGTTNRYVVQEIAAYLGKREMPDLRHFYRGITVKPSEKTHENLMPFRGDIVIEQGEIVKGQTIFDVASRLQKGDVIIKGANAVDAAHRTAGVLIRSANMGTSAPSLEAFIGRQVGLIMPVGLEKRVVGDIGEISAKLSASSSSGLRMLPMNGTILTELEAIQILTNAEAELVAAGGVGGAEGGCWVAVTGTEVQLDTAIRLLKPLVTEPTFSL